MHLFALAINVFACAHGAALGVYRFLRDAENGVGSLLMGVLLDLYCFKRG
jgi:hypothetical protein